MPANQDFLSIWQRSEKGLPPNFAQNTSFNWSSDSQNLHVVAWPVSGQEILNPKIKQVVCGTPVSRVLGRPVSDLVELDDFENIAGPFAALTIKDESCVEILNDSFGIHPVFWFKSEDLKICGSRADLVAHAAEILGTYKKSLNLACIKTLVVLSQAEGNHTALKDINVTPLGHKIKLTKHGMSSERFWPVDWRQAPRSKDAVREEIFEIVDGQINALKNLANESEHLLEVDLTGGKDSRAVLAMCHKADILDEVVFLTQGIESFPDVKIASNIARELDLNYVITDWLPPLQPWMEECKLKALESFGRRGCMEGALPKEGKTWRVKGFLGETWRTCYPNRREPKTMEIALNFHRSKFNFRKPFMKDPHFQKQLQRSEARLHRIHNNGNSLENITDIDFITQYQRVSFSGRIRNFDRVFLALYAPKAHRIAFSLGLETRREGWMMQQGYDYCSLNVDIPFTKQIVEDEKLNIETVKDYIFHGQKKLQSEKDHWQVLEGQMHPDIHDMNRAEFLREFLLSDPNHLIYQWVDYQKISDALSGPIGFNLQLSKMLLEMVTGKLWIDEFDDLMSRRRHYFG